MKGARLFLLHCKISIASWLDWSEWIVPLTYLSFSDNSLIKPQQQQQSFFQPNWRWRSQVHSARIGQEPKFSVENFGVSFVLHLRFCFIFLTFFNNNVNSLEYNQISSDLKTLIQTQIGKLPLSQEQQELLVKCVRDVAIAKTKEWLFILASTKSVKRVGVHSPVKLVPSDLIRELVKFFVWRWEEKERCKAVQRNWWKEACLVFFLKNNKFSISL